ncbi:Uncharacterized protein FWK35_00007715 [Aphis craccivora]|uniref:Uncharacterized protein n=1 Tax=Aphis craccivora TaxID=307492 RepID=A0A6G0ZIM3_APHCR|nr:Uncharacterized protein FWK35_00007715 [Aphis craccivora]
MTPSLTVRVELPDDSLYDSGALGDMSPAYWHAVTGGITHRASPPYSHVSGHAAAAGRVCGWPTALATGITGIRRRAAVQFTSGDGFVVRRDDSFREDCWRDGGCGDGGGFGFGRPTDVCAVSRRRCSLRAMLDESVVVLALRGTAPAGVDDQSAGSAATPPPSGPAIGPESRRTIYNTLLVRCIGVGV